jgi:curved DNA-binding protein CbpA
VTSAHVRDWATVDYYALLGVDPQADHDAITRAFRERAKRSHPDTAGDSDAGARFADLREAYAVLGDRDSRREYDRVRAEVRPPAPSPPRVVPARKPAAPKPWSRRRSLWVIVAGVLVAVLGVGAAWLTWSMHEHDARERARFIPVTAARGASGLVSFVTRDGQRIRAPEPSRHGDPNGNGLTMQIRYDPANPEHVIVGETSTARDITFAIVALKLLIGGPVFVALGAIRLRRARSRATSAR